MTQIWWNGGGMFVGADSQLKVSGPSREFVVEWDGPTKTLRVTASGKDVPMVEGPDGVWREKERE